MPFLFEERPQLITACTSTTAILVSGTENQGLNFLPLEIASTRQTPPPPPPNGNRKRSKYFNLPLLKALLSSASWVKWSQQSNGCFQAPGMNHIVLTVLLGRRSESLRACGSWGSRMESEVVNHWGGWDSFFPSCCLLRYTERMLCRIWTRRSKFGPSSSWVCTSRCKGQYQGWKMSVQFWHF